VCCCDVCDLGVVVGWGYFDEVCFDDVEVGEFVDDC